MFLDIKKAGISQLDLRFMVPRAGLEPARYCYRGILSSWGYIEQGVTKGLTWLFDTIWPHMEPLVEPLDID